MRSILFTISVDGRLNLGPLGNVPVFGLGLLLALWCLAGAGFLILMYRASRLKQVGFMAPLVWLAVAAAIVAVPKVAGGINGIPVYGYGTMLFIGFTASAALASYRLRRQGADGELAWDAAMWVFISGIVGARLFYVYQYSDQIFGNNPKTGNPRTLGEILIKLVNLPDGGLVLYGGLILAPLAYFVFCRRRQVSALALGDIVIPSVFVGIMFGRLGCLMHGCCYGDVSSVPWAVSFPPGSVPFESLVNKGFLASTAAHSLPLHPTQIYDALNGLLLVLLTLCYYPFRRRSGEVLAIGWIAYPINRFLIEFLRNDEIGQFGTSLTIAQWFSLGLLATGVAFFVWLQTRPWTRLALDQPAAPGGWLHGLPIVRWFSKRFFAR